MSVGKTQRKKLSIWYQNSARILPWRSQPTLYRVWVSEIMLQQTQVATVIPYFNRFIEYFPNVKALASAPVEAVEKAWAGLGYYSRARNLHLGAKRILEKGFPKTKSEWLEIPGVGPYTAGAICSIALDQPCAILDGNVERVFSRVALLKKGDLGFKDRLWELSDEFIQNSFKEGLSPRDMNQALMELGAKICSPKRPQCPKCPFNRGCLAKRQNEQERYPGTKKKEFKKISEKLYCIFNRDGKVLVRKRGPKEWRAGLWDFVDEIPKNQKFSEQGVILTKHVVTQHKIERKTVIGTLKKNVNLGADLGWIDPDHPEVATGSAFRKVIHAIRNDEMQFF